MEHCWKVIKWNFILFFFKILFIHETHREREREREREAKTQAEGEVGSMQGAQCGTRSWVSRIRPRLKVALNHWATGAAQSGILKNNYKTFKMRDVHHPY